MNKEYDYVAKKTLFDENNKQTESYFQSDKKEGFNNNIETNKRHEEMKALFEARKKLLEQKEENSEGKKR